MGTVYKIHPGSKPEEWKIWDKLTDNSPTWLQQVKCIVVEPKARKWRIIVNGTSAPKEERSTIARTLVTQIEPLQQVEIVAAVEDAKQEPASTQEVHEVTDEANYMEMINKMAPKLTAAPPDTGKNGGGKPGRNGKDGVILGRVIKEEPVSLQAIEDEEKSVVVAGEVINLDVREMRTGRRLITFDLVDAAAGLSVKIFEEKGSDLTEAISEGCWLKAQGPVKYDNFTQELTLIPRSINDYRPALREDDAPEKRVELHLHTKMSAMDGVVDVEKAVATAARWEHKAVAITDHGVVQAFPEAYAAGKKHGIKIIYGMEGYLVEEDSKQAPSYHIILLAENYTGLKNLYKLVSYSHLQHFYRRPRLPRQLLKEHREGLIIGSACEAGELYRAAASGASDQQLEDIARFYDYIEIQPIGNNRFMIGRQVNSEEDLRQINRRLVEIAEKLGKPVVATGDVHFLEPEDEVYRRILMSGQGFDDAENQAPLYLKTTREMLEEFAYLGEDKAYEVVVTNPGLIASRVEEMRPVPEELHPPIMEGAEDEIVSMTYKRAHQIYGEELPDIVAKRLEKELKSIVDNGFAVLYLIAHKLVRKSLDDGYLVGSRGSVGSSLVATMCDITEVNPLPPHYICPECCYSRFFTDGSVGAGVDLPDKECPECGAPLRKEGLDIPFEVFLGFHGDKVPDIDLNFSGDYQPQVHKYCEKLFGKEYVYRAGTIATIADRTAYGFVRKYLEEKGVQARSSTINKLVRGCTGVRRTTGQHPGGMMVVPRGEDVHDFTPIQRPANDMSSETITTHFDYHAISERLVKLDILGHDDPTTLRMLQDLTGIDARSIPLDDARTMAIFSSTEPLGVDPEKIGTSVGTLGIPEFGTRFVRGMLEETRPKTFSELVRISGFSHGTNVWNNNAQDLIREGRADLSQAIATRDDIMNFLIQCGMEPGKAFRIMEKVRKGKGLTEEDIAEMKAVNVPGWYIGSCLKISYLFPKAHAAAYTTMAFRIAYFKVHHPEAFYATYFTVKSGEFDADLVVKGEAAIKETIDSIARKGGDATAKEEAQVTVLEIVLEAMARGIRFLPVDLYESDASKFKITSAGLVPPLVSLKGVGQSAAESIASCRADGPFTSIEDLRQRSGVTKTVVEVLREHGSLDGLPESNQLRLF